MVLLILRVLEVPRKCVRWAWHGADLSRWRWTCQGLLVFMRSHQPSGALRCPQWSAETQSCSEQWDVHIFQGGQMGQQSRAFLATCGLRADDEGDSLKVYDLVRGLEVVELTGHPDHVMCGSMSWSDIWLVISSIYISIWRDIYFWIVFFAAFFF